MSDSEKIFYLLEKASKEKLSHEEALFLERELTGEEIKEYANVLEIFNHGVFELAPSPKLKDKLLHSFNLDKSKTVSTKNINKKVQLLKIAAIGIILIGIGFFFYLRNPNQEKMQESKVSIEEFNNNTKIEEQNQKNQLEQSESSKYLMSVDFFNNSQLSN
ncbi:MAG: hypothetical protein RJQ00_03100 [Vicingaceae bacterium]